MGINAWSMSRIRFMMKCKSNEGDYLIKFLSANTEIFQDYGTSLARQLANGIS